jgi:bacteriorhodopsin
MANRVGGDGTESSDDYRLLRRQSKRWRWYGVACVAGVVAVAYLATGLASHNENVQLAGGLAIIFLVLGAIYCFAKASAKAVSASAVRPRKNR